MEESRKKTIVLVIMFIVVLSVASYATSLQIKQTVITFPDGYKISVTSSKNLETKGILEENNIVLLNDEVINTVEDDNTLNIYITKKEDIHVETIEKDKNNKDIDLNKVYNNYREEIEKTIVEIPFKSIVKEKSSNETNSKIIQKGKNGKKEITYRSTYIGDKLVAKQEISSKIIVKPIDKIVSVEPKVTSRTGSTRIGAAYGYSAQEIDLLCAITAQESASSYEGALAVMTTACNRAVSSKWKSRGADPLSQYKAKGQFTYSIDGKYKKRLNGNYPAHVKKAVLDALGGKRNHNYLSFRSASSKYNGVIIGGNVYFNPM